MKKLAILLVLIFWSQPLMAANRCYETTTNEDKVIQWMANRDSVTPIVAFTQLVGSAISIVKDEARRSAENPLIDSSRLCLNNNQSFVITKDVNTDLAVGVCQ